MSLTLSRQLKAARALVGWDQQQLADAADVAVNTVRRMEAGDGTINANAETVRRVVQALADGGVEIIGSGALTTSAVGPGVRLKGV